MDSRKPIGRTASELAEVFTRLPEAGLCFDIGHAWQIDPTMGEAYWILKWFGGRLRQLHVSEVNSRSKHDVLSFATIQSFKEVAHMIPDDVPIVLETPVGQSSIQSEIKKARFALAAGSSPIPTSAGDLSLIAR
jgi:sugar phosphate isomerase/epimerase